MKRSKKTLLLNLLLFYFLQDGFGQVSGRLITAAGQPIPSANVLLEDRMDTSLVKATLTNEKGAYLFENIPQGKYILRCSSIGYQTWSSPVFELTDSQRTKDFGTMVLKEDARQLDEAVVRVVRPFSRQQMDGIVVNVESSLLTKGSSALEVLERSPGVIIDHQNNSISLNGKNGVIVMLDSKLLHMSIEQVVVLLNGMSADNIEKIELLTTPPSRYDAEGSAGIINIVLKKNKKKGTNGSLSLTGGYGWGEKGTAGLNLDHNTGKMDLYGSYTFTHDRSFSDWHSVGTNNVPLLGGQNYTDILSDIRPTSDNHNATLGLEARLSPKITVGGNINYNYSQVAVNTVNHATYDFAPDSTYTLNANINGRNHWSNWITSLYAEKKIGDGGQIDFDMDYLYYNNNAPTDAHSSYLDEYGNPGGTNDTLFSPWQKGFANTTIQVGVAKMDYSKQLTRTLKWETGAKGTYTRDASSSGILSLVNGTWVSRSETSDDIVMKESIGAVYTSLDAQLNPSTSLVLGARYEYSHTRMVDPDKQQVVADRRLGVLFPDLFLSKKLNDHSDLYLSWTKRISRPSYNDLASFVTYASPNSVESGNPLLRPTITNNWKVGYNIHGYSFSVLLSRDDYPIAGYQLTVSPGGDLIDLSPQNLVYQNNLTFQASLPWKVSNCWNMNYGFVGGWRQFKEDYTVQPAGKTYFGYSVNFSESFKLPRNFSLELSGWYNASSYDGTKKKREPER